MFTVKTQLQFQSKPTDVSTFDTITKQVASLDQLADDLHDWDTEGELSSGRIAINLNVDSVTPAAAVARANELVQTALGMVSTATPTGVSAELAGS